MSTMRHLLPIVALAFAMPLHAQTGEPAGPGGQYYFQGVYNPVIADVKKLDMRPLPFDSIIPAEPLNYQMIPAKFEVPARVDTIAAAKVNVQATQEKLYKGYVKAGFGLYTTPLAELYYDQTRDRDRGFGLHVKHLSSNGGIDNAGPSDYGRNRIEGFYKTFLPHHEVGGNIVYDRRRVNYYGFDPLAFDSLGLDVPTSAELKQFYNDIGFAARVKSLYGDSARIAHAVGMEVHTYSNRQQSRETSLRLTADLSKADGSETYSAGVLIDNNAYRGKPAEDVADLRQNGTLIGLTPAVSTEGAKYVVKVGVGMYLDAMGKTTFHFFPNAYLSYSLFGDMLVPYLGVDGRRQRNGFRSLTQENPWLVAAPNLKNSSLMYDIHGGLRGSFSSTMGFDVRVSALRWKDKPLYVNETVLSFGNAFVPVYDEVNVVDMMGQLNYAVGERTSVSGRIDIYTYRTDEQAEAWNLPPYELALVARYDLRDKLILKAEAQFMGRRRALVNAVSDMQTLTAVDPVEVDLDGYLDLYLGAEYRYNKRLSVFLDVSNLSASKYERWADHPVQRTLFMGGATYAF